MRIVVDKHSFSYWIGMEYIERGIQHLPLGREIGDLELMSIEERKRIHILFRFILRIE